MWPYWNLQTSPHQTMLDWISTTIWRVRWRANFLWGQWMPLNIHWVVFCFDAKEDKAMIGLGSALPCPPTRKCQCISQQLEEHRGTIILPWMMSPSIVETAHVSLKYHKYKDQSCLYDYRIICFIRWPTILNRHFNLDNPQCTCCRWSVLSRNYIVDLCNIS